MRKEDRDEGRAKAISIPAPSPRVLDLYDVSQLSLWEAIRPDSPRDNARAYPVGVYLFECLHCHKHIVLWDCE